MEIKKGYKMTDVGVIPEDWEVKKIEPDLGRVKSGKRLPLGYFVIPNKNNHPYIRVIDMNMGYIDTSSIMYVAEEAYNYIEQYIITKDDIYISVAGTLGLIGKIPEYLDGANLTENANRITEIKCDRDYLMYWLMSGYIQDCIKDSQTLGAQPKLAVYQIRDFLVALPQSVGEQQAIADALTKVDNLIMSLSKVIEKKKLIKKGTMQKLLSGEVRLDGFDGEWEQKTIKDIAVVEKGELLISSQYENGNIEVWAGGKVPAGLHNVANRAKNTITISASGAYAGFVSYHDCPIFATDCSTISESTDFDVKYLYYSLINIQDKIYEMQTGGAQPHVHAKDIYPIELTMPPTKAEQTAIAKVLTTTDDEIEALEKERDKYKCIKQGMMQQLLTGKIRLICQ